MTCRPPSFFSWVSITNGSLTPTKAALETINESSPATAIQGVNDLVAIGCTETLLHQGRKIPEEISIAGFGNVMAAAHFRVPLTTVRQPKHRLGSATMDCLLQLLRGEKAQSRQLPATLAIRASTALPPRA